MYQAKPRVAGYQAWYNIVRVSSNKDYKSRWQIIRELNPKMGIELVRLPPLMLDWLGPDYITKWVRLRSPSPILSVVEGEELSLRGYDLPYVIPLQLIAKSKTNKISQQNLDIFLLAISSFLLIIMLFDL